MPEDKSGPTGQAPPVVGKDANMLRVAGQLQTFLMSCEAKFLVPGNSFRSVTAALLAMSVIELMSDEFGTYTPTWTYTPTSYIAAWEESYRVSLKKFLEDSASGKFNERKIWEMGALSESPIRKDPEGA